MMSVIKNIANLLTTSRFLFTVGMTLTAPFSAAFRVCYLACGISDLLDGAVARRLHIQSVAGAKLDSAADLAFAAAIAVVVVRILQLPAWLWICAGCIAGAAYELCRGSCKIPRLFCPAHLCKQGDRRTDFCVSAVVCDFWTDRVRRALRCGGTFLVRGGACNHCEISHAEPGLQRAVSNKTQFGVKKEG
ncbi:hypothetical protein OBV_32690 [Oscillibacter valericigenes Sjm18-20]|nr:hypothetical protein OBV_32690 [Oscillibacter valericigenes Sjm18-20]